MKLVHALSPLANRDLRVLLVGLAATLTGGGVWIVAVAVAVIDLGGAPAAHGAAAT